MKRIFTVILTVCVLCLFAGCKKPNTGTTPTNTPGTDPATQATPVPTATGVETEEDEFDTPGNSSSNTPNNGSDANGSDSNSGNNNSNGNNSGNSNNGDGSNSGSTNTAVPDSPTPTPTEDDGIIRLPEINW